MTKPSLLGWAFKFDYYKAKRADLCPPFASLCLIIKSLVSSLELEAGSVLFCKLRPLGQFCAVNGADL